MRINIAIYESLHYVALSLKDASRKARQALNGIADGKNPLTAKIEERTAETFKALAAEYLERHAKPHKKSWQEDERVINRDLLTFFGATRAKEITRQDINSILEKKAATAPVQANRMRSLLNKMFRWAIRKGEFGIENNPVYLTEMPGGKECARDRVLTAAEIKQTWAALDTLMQIDGDHDKAHRKYRVLSGLSLKLRLLTAQRGDEVQSMEWSEIDLASGWWTIPAEKTKNGLAHRVYLTPQSLRIIEEARKLCEKKPSKYVFPGPRGGYLCNVQKAIERIRTTTGIRFRGHDLRRTTASMMAGDGIPRFTVGRILNHVEPGVTKIYDRYSYDKEKKEALEAWSKRLLLMASDLKEVKSEA
ncbi:MAG TPA: site-specific integrase [Methylomirabilota bacterium]|nr:site-specific integrase [Methylomirabilota bacterium]